jgi:YD repeat-containing protein
MSLRLGYPSRNLLAVHGNGAGRRVKFTLTSLFRWCVCFWIMLFATSIHAEYWPAVQVWSVDGDSFEGISYHDFHVSYENLNKYPATKAEACKYRFDHRGPKNDYPPLTFIGDDGTYCRYTNFYGEQLGHYSSRYICSFDASALTVSGQCYNPNNCPSPYVRQANGSCGCPTGTRYFDDVKQCVVVIQVPNASSPPNKPSDNGPNCQPNVNKRQPSCGEPINPGSRNMWHTERDYDGTANLGELALVRTYNSSPYNWDASAVRSFGNRWTQPFDAVLKQEALTAQEGFPGTCWRREDTQYVWCENYVPTLPTTTSAIPQAVSVLRGDGKKYLFHGIGTSWVGDADTNDRITATYNADNSAILGWTYISARGDTTERYNASGVLVSVTSRNGAIQRLTYSNGVTNDTSVGRSPADAPICTHVPPGGVLAAGRLLCVTDNWGRQLQFEYDSKGRIVKAIDSANQAWLYEYDGPSGGCFLSNGTANRACAANNLTKITNPEGKSRIYYYNETAQINNGAACSGMVAVGNGFAHLLNSMTGLVDENGGRYITWTYDCLGRATSSQRGVGINKVALSYGDFSSSDMATTTVTHYVGAVNSPQTTVRSYSYQKVLGVAKNIDIDQNCVECGPVKRRTYDANGNVDSAIDWNNYQTCYAYNMARNLETARIEGLASTATCATALGTTSLIAPQRKISTQWHPGSRLPSAIAEPQRLTTFSYDGNGNLLTKSEQATSDVTGAQAFNAAAVGTPRVWRYTYNDVGQVLTATDPLGNLSSYSYDDQGNLVAVTNAAGHVTTLSHYDAHGRVGRIVDPNGLITDLSYHPRGWLSAKTVGGETTGYEYDGVGQLTKATLPDGSSLTYTYDEAHRLTDIADSLGNRIAYTLDLTGNRIKEQVTDPTGTLARQTTRVYDALNRLQKITGGQP